MNKLALSLAVTAALGLGIPAVPATASMETYEARATASAAAANAREDMVEAFGKDDLAAGKYVWRDVPAEAGAERVVISLDDQMAYLYRGNTMMAAAAISTGRKGHPTPPGIFNILEKREMYHSKKYDNAAMPFMQRIDQFGIALHAGPNPGRPASHGCIRLPSAFAKKLFAVTEVGTPVLIGA